MHIQKRTSSILIDRFTCQHSITSWKIWVWPWWPSKIQHFHQRQTLWKIGFLSYKSTYAFFKLIFRKLMTPYGGMGYGTKCGKWVQKVRCGGLLGLNMQTVGVVCFWKASLLNLSQLIRGLPKVALCHPHCFWLTRKKVSVKLDFK